MIEAVLLWAERHPRLAGTVNAIDVVLGRPVARAVEASVRRLDLRLRIRACGGRARWYEGEAALAARLDRLARTGAA